mmetsp:Transcript_6779/g.18997  ORF Transcript_6779/g.18997 Transcript_6779/m.18997 type:complete len:287 (-) Transcript_6779:1916-2776(-)
MTISRVASQRQSRVKRPPSPPARSSDCNSQDGSDQSEQFEETGLSASVLSTNIPLADWVKDLERAVFFRSCAQHAHLKRHESTFYCITCGGGKPLCHQCLQDHEGHAVLQLRRYVYEDVVNTSDMSQLMNINEIQTYTINQAPVVFLRERPQQQQRNNNRNGCKMCRRPLKDGYSFCSVGCKVSAAINWNAPSLIELNKSSETPAERLPTTKLAALHQHKKRIRSPAAAESKKRKVEALRVTPADSQLQSEPDAVKPSFHHRCAVQLAAYRAGRRKQILPRRSPPV